MSLFNEITFFAALGGAMTGSYLTYRFQRKDKIRDHLFTHKVKSYSTLAECIVGVKRDIEDKRGKIRVKREEDAKTITAIWGDFRKVCDEQTLFLSDQTKHDLLILEGIIFEAFNMEIERIIDIDNFTDGQMIDVCGKVIEDCEDFIKKLQNEIGVNAVNPKLNIRKL
ncbi:hypothetical protein [Chryseobacterium vrystaatense]|uniref:Uncharacterized protein n=1 Tax=Chryseobacterium vrystaatense TaxID=307480 RepID=A0A1M5HCY6_9FLAO|nr:hypothetical protein [Chryseobacterium vrystaatense]SHG13748.1 hypothetical protein SAMN02787073_3661 [Chryseobacterium vrystaatense]